jgi:hypothetical protein
VCLLPTYLLLLSPQSLIAFTTLILVLALPTQHDTTAMASSIKGSSSSPVTEQSISFPRTPTQNPYQRIASRRAIACVTCAKAKTKCDKGVRWLSFLISSQTDMRSFLHARGASPRVSSVIPGQPAGLPTTTIEQTSGSPSSHPNVIIQVALSLLLPATPLPGVFLPRANHVPCAQHHI